MFDPEIRLKRFRQELQDDEVAVILLEFITGPGVAKEPVKEFAIEAKKAIAEKHITVISNICGSRRTRRTSSFRQRCCVTQESS